MATTSLGADQLEPRDFAFLRDLIMREAGIHVTEQKRQLIEGRLGRRLRVLGLRDFHAYVRLLQDGDEDGTETLEFINCITTNKTAFFREPHHFDYLRDEVLPSVAGRPLRVWCAASSTGEEPYSIAMTVLDAGQRAEIVASDIDTNVLATARRGVYDEERLEGIPHEAKRRHFLRGEGDKAGWCKVRPELSAMIDFKRINLIDEQWPLDGLYDVIFCRNVVIYFNRETQETLFRRMAERLAPGGILILGHSENLSWMSDRYEPIGKTIYRLRGATHAPSRGSSRAAASFERVAAHAPVVAASVAPVTIAEPTRAIVRIEAGSVHASKSPSEVRTVLGSCVSACLYDPLLGIGGMNHFMLPMGEHATRPARYGVHAMELLINQIMKLGGDRTRLRAKVFGGASVIKALASTSDVGRRNAEFIRTFLAAERIPIDAERLGGTSPLEVRMTTDTGHVRVRALQSDMLDEVVRDEQRSTKRSMEVMGLILDPDACLF